MSVWNAGVGYKVLLKVEGKLPVHCNFSSEEEAEIPWG
jgi:hypothetical protein